MSYSRNGTIRIRPDKGNPRRLRPFSSNLSEACGEEGQAHDLDFLRARLLAPSSKNLHAGTRETLDLLV